MVEKFVSDKTIPPDLLFASFIHSFSFVFYFLQVLISVSAFCVVTYTKVAISSLMREEGRKPLLWCGISTQLGSFLGAVSIFAPVNVYHMFKEH